MIRCFGCFVGALTISLSTNAFGIGDAELSLLKQRINKYPASRNIEYHEAIDIASVFRDWSLNPARAMLKYNKPNSYRGKLKRVYVRNGSDGDLIFYAGKAGEVTAILFPYQVGPWVRNEKNKWIPEGAMTTLEFAGQYDKGQEFVLSCSQAQPGYLLDCLAFPGEVVRESSK